jgi:aarF domain-containing kinase
MNTERNESTHCHEEEVSLRKAAIVAWTSLLATAAVGSSETIYDSNTTTTSHLHVHPDCAILILLDTKGTYTTGRKQLQHTIQQHWTTDWISTAPAHHSPVLGFWVEACKILSQGQQSAASVKFTIIDTDQNEVYAGYMVFLHDTPTTTTTNYSSNASWIWNCISVALAPSNYYNNKAKKSQQQILPTSFHDITALTWDGYCRANRQCDGNLMAKYFHSTCRLTYSSSKADKESYTPLIVICDSDAFYEKVSNRYTGEAIHQNYQHLQHNPSVGDWDTLKSIEFATPDLCMVVLDVGHPPFLWTDLLTCARIGRRQQLRHGENNEVNDDIDIDNETKWWIIHKSSECELHPLINDGKAIRRERTKRNTRGIFQSMVLTMVCSLVILHFDTFFLPQQNGVSAFSTSHSLHEGQFHPAAYLGLASPWASLVYRNDDTSTIPLLSSETTKRKDRYEEYHDNVQEKSGWWSFTFPSSLRSSNMEFPDIELPDAIVMIQETHEKYLESLQIVKKRRVFQRTVEIFSILCGEILRPVLCSIVESKPDLSTIHIPTDQDWDKFWREKRGKKQLSNAERVAQGIPALGPTFVKLALILATRPDVLPIPLAEALGDLHYNVPPFDDATAKRMIRTDLKTALTKQQQQNFSISVSQFLEDKQDIDRFMNSLSKKPVATGGIAQVYKGFLPGFGDIAVKVLRPGVRRKVERDITLFHSAATWIEYISHNTMKLPFVNVDIGSVRLVEAVDEFTSRVLEDMDFIREAENMKAFANLYDARKGSSPTVKIVVPQVLSELSSNRIIVMEWIEGTKLTEVCDDCNDREEIEKENLELIVLAIEMTVSQLIDHGLLHGDPNLAHVLKVRNPQTGNPEIGYIDFGIVSYVPQNFRDAIVCAVTQLVFARNLEAVAELCVEMGLLPQETLTDPSERRRLLEALQTTMDEVLIWPKNPKGVSTAVPTIRFENLLPALSKFIQSFEFTMPPYFLNNVRALAALEAMALKLDPNFNVLRVIYPYSINRLMRNPTVSKKVQNTFLEICRNPDTKLLSPRRVQMLLNDWALWTGYRKRKIFWDLASSAGGRRVTPVILHNWMLNRIQNVKTLMYLGKLLIVNGGKRLNRLLGVSAWPMRRMYASTQTP